MRKFFIPIYLLHLSFISAQNFEEVAPSPFKSFYYSAAAVEDYDKDGYLDVFFTGALDVDNNGNVDSTINELYKNENGNFKVQQRFEDKAVHLSDVKFIDFDNDGLLDAVTTGLSYNNVVDYRHYRWKNNGSTFELLDELQGRIYGNIEVGDLNNDGKSDYLINGIQYNHTTSMFSYVSDLYVNNGTGFTLSTQPLPGGQNGIARLIDINNDNLLDLVICGFSRGSKRFFDIYKNENGTFKLSQSFEGLVSGDIAYADFDADGDMDLIVSGSNDNYDSKLKYYTNNGTGTFVEHSFNDSDAIDSSTIDVGDINNDGVYDFIIIGNGDNYTNAIKTFIFDPNSKTFSLTPHNLYQLGSNGGIKLLDYNNDNLLDVLAYGFDWGQKNYPFYVKLSKNINATTNAKPKPPTTLTAEVQDEYVHFKWEGASDDTTAEKALQYELSVGSQSGKSDIAKYKVTTPNWKLNKSQLPQQIFWSVKSIDASKVYSESSTEQSTAILSTADAVHKQETRIYPNPVKDILNVQTENKIVSYKIYNTTGQVVLLKNTHSKQLDVSTLEKGVYFVEIEFENAQPYKTKIITN